MCSAFSSIKTKLSIAYRFLFRSVLVVKNTVLALQITDFSSAIFFSGDVCKLGFTHASCAERQHYLILLYS